MSTAKEFTLDDIARLRDTIKVSEGWDGDDWDIAMANAVAQSLRAPVQAQGALTEREQFEAWHTRAMGSPGFKVYSVYNSAELVAAWAAWQAGRAALAQAQPASADDARDASRWRQAIRYVGADRSPALGISYFVLRGVPAMPGVDLMRGSVAQNFAESIDQARYQADMAVIDAQRERRQLAGPASTGSAP